MREQRNKISFRGQKIYVGIDVHLKSWSVTVLSETSVLKKFSQHPSPEALYGFLTRSYPGAEYHSVYEAGFCGFWIHERLTALGIDNIVVNPADVPTKSSEKLRKTDTVDSGKLARSLRANELKGIYTPDSGQISLRIVQKDTASAGFADFEFHIKDNGIGMSEEFQKHIFEQFARERTSTGSKIQGTGLGLAITKSLVDMMGGRITVESEPGRGSEFTISLRFPVGEAKAGQMIPVSKASDFTGKKLLVVEDNELNLEIASTLLEEVGFEVDTAGNGKIAVEKVEAASAGRYDLILMDVQMPEMDGYEATRRIRALPDKKKAAIPIVAMTANAFEEDQKNALNVGMNGHIAKPLDIQKLFQVLSELLK